MGEDVGILGMEIYFPTQYVEQSDLEKFDGVSEGKYTKGLGQLRMGFCADCEDSISMALTVTKRLLENNSVDPARIGRLEVGTESGIDRSKSTKSYLMQLFGDNHDICGLDTVQACFGGTQALFNAVDWLTSASWDGRLAVVVASDVAVYPPGPARPTGGAGAIAMLVGPNAPLIIEPRLRACYAAHVYDFYKPDPSSEYPLVDGMLSINSYLNAAVSCYENFAKKADDLLKNPNFGLKDVCGVLFHSPYTRLVEKAFAKLVLSDVQRGAAVEGELLSGEEIASIEQKSSTPPQVNGHSHHVNGNSTNGHANGHHHHQDNLQPSAELLAAARRSFSLLTSPALWLSREIGNMYTPSLYACLASFLASCHHDNRNIFLPKSELPVNPRILMFSYGSGLAAAMFSIRLNVSSPHFAHLCDKLNADIKNRLARRRCAMPTDLVAALAKRHTLFGKAAIDDWNHETAVANGLVEDGVFVLAKIDDRFRRTYVYVEPPSNSSSPSVSMPVSKAMIHNNSSTADKFQNAVRFVDSSPLKNGYHHSD